MVVNIRAVLETLKVHSFMGQMFLSLEAWAWMQGTQGSCSYGVYIYIDIDNKPKNMPVSGKSYRGEKG